MHFEGTLFPVRRIQLPRDRKTRRTPGKRSLTRSGDKRGRYVRSTTVERTTDLAFDATLRAAAPHQPSRRAAELPEDGDGPALKLERQDLRQKVRQRRTGTLIVFVVDASASMDAEQRMQATKGAVLSLLRDAYVRRDKVALVVFSGRTARGIENRFLLAHSEVAPAAYPEVHHLTSPMRKAAREAGLAGYVNLWAGQAYPLTGTMPAGDVVRELWAQARAALSQASARHA